MARSEGGVAPGMAAELRPGVLVRRLQHLISIRSVNPGTSETAAARAVAGFLKDVPGIELHEVEALPGRTALAAVLRGLHGGPRVVLNGHLDTVPEGDPAEWSVPPFEGRTLDGYVYGRGACDMKAGVVAQIAACRGLAAAGGPRRGVLILHFAVGEECAEPGTRALIDAGFGGDVGIVTEPTGLGVATAARGMACFRVTVHGRPGHGSSPRDGDNPILAVPDVLTSVERYSLQRSGHHPLLGSGSCTPTMVHAGALRNGTPGTCELVFDRRLLPGQDAATELAELERALRAALDGHPLLRCEVTCDPLGFAAAEIAHDSPFAALVNSAREAVTGDEAPITGTRFSSDVHVLVNDAGMEAVTFGPGHISECHCPDERVAIRELEMAARTLSLVVSDLLG